MYKKLLTFCLVILFSWYLQAEDKELVIYTNKFLPMQGTINKMFFDKTGIMVTTISSSEDDLLNKLSKQKFRDKADLVMGATLYEMEIIKESGYLQVIENTEISKIIPDNYKDKTGYLIPISVNPRLLVYNKYTLPKDTFNSYMNIFPTEFNMKTSQRTFLNKYNRSLVAYLLKNHGEAEVKKWLLNLSDNMLEKPKGNDRYSLRQVAKAESAYTFVNGSDLGLMMNSKKKDEKKLTKSLEFKTNVLDNALNNENIKNKEVEYIFVNIFSVGLLKNAKNKDYAIEYIKFLLSKDIQNYIAKTSYEIPINQDAYPDKMYSDIKNLILKNIDYNEIIFYNIKADNLIREIPNLLP